jgi:hypothetical protein
MSAGKGDKLRKGADLKAYWNHYDEIFRKKTVEQSAVVMHNEQHKSTTNEKTTDRSSQ